MAAPTNAANVKKALANPEPSTHGPKAKCHDVRYSAAVGVKADSARTSPNDVNDPLADIGIDRRGVRILNVR
jgi:hypothetical protein